MVGTIGVTFNYSIFFVMYRYLHVYYIISSATGFILAIFLAFYLNKRFTFKVHSNKIKEMIIKYFSVNIFSLFLGMCSLAILVELFNINVYIANILTLGITTISNFSGSKLFAFKIKTK
jgi:putative flippase GtrA